MDLLEIKGNSTTLKLKSWIKFFKTKTNNIMICQTSGISNIKIRKYMKYIRAQGYDIAIYDKVFIWMKIASGLGLTSNNIIKFYLLFSNEGFFEFIDDTNYITRYLNKLVFQFNEIKKCESIYKEIISKFIKEIKNYIDWLNFPRKLTNIAIIMSYDTSQISENDISFLIKNLKSIVNDIKNSIDIDFIIGVHKVYQLHNDQYNKDIITGGNKLKLIERINNVHEINFYDATEKELKVKLTTYNELLNFKIQK